MSDNSAGDPAAPLGGDTPASNPQAEPEPKPNNAGDAAASGGPGEPGQDQRQTEGEGTTEGEQPKEKPERLGGFQRRQIRLEAERDFLRDELSRLRGQGGADRPGNQQPTVSDAAPDPRDTSKYPLGSHDPDYIKDSAKHEFRQEQAQERQREREAQQADEIGRAATVFHARVEQLEASMPGIGESVAAAKAREFPLSDAMAFAIIESGRPEIAHYLNHHRDEAARIARMSPIQAAREIGRLEAKLPEASTRRQTAAPAPPKEVAGGQSRVATFDPARFKGGDDEAAHENYRAWRAKQG